MVVLKSSAAASAASEQERRNHCFRRKFMSALAEVKDERVTKIANVLRGTIETAMPIWYN